MGPEVWLAVAAVFVSGSAIGAAGTLLAQWVVRKLDSGDARHPVAFDARELAMLRGDVADMAHQIRNLDARLDFQEQLLSGSTPTEPPPPRLPTLELPDGES